MTAESILRDHLTQSGLLRKVAPAATLVAGISTGASHSVLVFGPGHASQRMEAGSLTKIFTALALAQLVLRGAVTLDAPLEMLIGRRSSPNARPIRLIDLATHTSGLPRLPKRLLLMAALRGSRDPYASETEANLRRDLRGLRQGRPEEVTFAYSNFGYAALGLAFQAVTSQPYEALLSELVLDPVQTKETELQITGRSLLVARGRSSSGGAVPQWRWQAYAPVGGVCTTITDLLLLGDALTHPNGKLARAMELAASPRVAVSGGAVGLGWMLPTASDWAWMNGGTGGYSSYFAVNRRQRTTLALLLDQQLAADLTPKATPSAESSPRKSPKTES